MPEQTAQAKKLKHVTIYTDGACLGNPGPGGYCAILVYKSHRRELSGGYRQTTNNRMELMAAIAGLEALKEKCQVTLYSDSEYLVKAMSRGWAQRWRANGWKRNKREKVLNPDLWERLLQLCDFHEVKFSWVKGHGGSRENTRCDEVAMRAAQQPNLCDDKGYISQSGERRRVGSTGCGRACEGERTTKHVEENQQKCQNSSECKSLNKISCSPVAQW